MSSGSTLARKSNRRMKEPGSDLLEDLLGEQLLEVDGRLDLADAAVGRDDLVAAAGAVAHVLLADQPLGLDRGDRVLLQLDLAVQPEDDPRLVVGQPDRLDPPDLHPGDLDGRAGLQPAYRGKVHRDDVAGAAQERHAPELDR